MRSGNSSAGLTAVANITKQHAVKIVKKLGAELARRGKRHNQYLVRHGDVVIAHFGVSRSPQKDKGQDHIPDAIHLGPHDTLLLGQCPYSRNDWLKHMREKGYLS